VLHCVAQLCERYGIGMKGFSPEFIDCLGNYEWPGNVRELKHALESAMAATADDPLLFQQHLPTHIRIHLARNGLRKKDVSETVGSFPRAFKENRQCAVEATEHQYLQDLMTFTGWDIKKACHISCLSRPRLYGLLQKYGVTREKSLKVVS
jgi:two-component system, NtrC family, response regulator